MTKNTHASSPVKVKTVFSTELLSETGSKPIKTFYREIAALCRNRTMFP